MSKAGQRLIAIVREKAAAEPNRVYHPPVVDGPCVYVHDGEPSCLVGQALWVDGQIDCSLEEQDDLNIDTIGKLLYHLGLGLDEEEVHWLRNVQARQDNKHPWGAAVAWADRHTRLVA